MASSSSNNDGPKRSERPRPRLLAPTFLLATFQDDSSRTNSPASRALGPPSLSQQITPPLSSSPSLAQLKEQQQQRPANEGTPLIGLGSPFRQGVWSMWRSSGSSGHDSGESLNNNAGGMGMGNEEAGLPGIGSPNSPEDRRSRSPLSSVMLFLSILFFASSCGALALASFSSSSSSSPHPHSSSTPSFTSTAVELLVEPEDSTVASSSSSSSSSSSFSSSSSSSSSSTIIPSLTPLPPLYPILPQPLALGVCWAPKHNMNVTNAAAEILEDALLIRRHFRQVRTFYSSFYTTPVMPSFVQAGLKVVLGVFMYPEEPTWTEAEKAAAIQSAVAYPEETLAIYVGNENVFPYKNYTVEALVAHMQDVREGVREGLRKAGREGGRVPPVGTVQRLTEWMIEGEEMDKLAEGSDLLGVNLYPYFSMDGEDLETQWEKMVRRYPRHAHKIRMTETGWPSAGSPNFANLTASHEQAEEYYNTYLKWACNQQAEAASKEGGGREGEKGQTTAAAAAAAAVKETFYYAYFDGRAPTVAPDYEAHFGLVREDGNEPKFALADGFCPGEKREEEKEMEVEGEEEAEGGEGEGGVGR